MSDDWLARMIREAQTESERATGQVDIGLARRPEGFARNQFTFFAEDFGSPETPTMRAERLKHERERRRLRYRLRQLRWFIRDRARETWGVLLHGLPETY